MLSLREHSRNLYESSWENRIKVGDVVLIKAFNKPRPYWLMGKVLELIMGRDSKVRTVKIKQSNGVTEYHAISNLYPLEVSVTHAGRDVRDIPANGSTGHGSGPSNISTESRPKRKATERFHRMMKNKIEDI